MSTWLTIVTPGAGRGGAVVAELPEIPLVEAAISGLIRFNASSAPACRSAELGD
jgi:hypothetical protein